MKIIINKHYKALSTRSKTIEILKEKYDTIQRIIKENKTEESADIMEEYIEDLIKTAIKGVPSSKDKGHPMPVFLVDNREFFESLYKKKDIFLKSLE